MNVSAHNLMTLIKRTSLNVYEADIFNCSRQVLAQVERDRGAARSRHTHVCEHLQIARLAQLVLAMSDSGAEKAASALATAPGAFVMLCVVQLDGAARSLRPRFTPCGASGRATFGVG